MSLARNLSLVSIICLLNITEQHDLFCPKEQWRWILQNKNAQTLQSDFPFWRIHFTPFTAAENVCCHRLFSFWVRLRCEIDSLELSWERTNLKNKRIGFPRRKSHWPSEDQISHLKALNRTKVNRECKTVRSAVLAVWNVFFWAAISLCLKQLYPWFSPFHPYLHIAARANSANKRFRFRLHFIHMKWQIPNFSVRLQAPSKWT